METTILNATEYRNVSLSLLNESKTNPRRIFEDAALKELADSIRSQFKSSLLFSSGLSPRRTSRLSPGQGVFAPRRSQRLPLFPFASLIFPMPKHSKRS
jgi:hypothetical protein